MRLFVALELPDEVSSALAAWAAAALERRPGIRLVAPDALHVTLCFIGSRPVSELDAIGAAVRSVVDGLRGPLHLRLDAPLLLPRRRPRAVAVGLIAIAPDPDSGGPTALDALQAELSARLVAGGWHRPERRPFAAHVTVARVGARARVSLSELPAPGGGSCTDRCRDPATGATPTRWERPFSAPTVTLFRSYTDPGGARYEPLLRAPLER